MTKSNFQVIIGLFSIHFPSAAPISSGSRSFPSAICTTAESKFLDFHRGNAVPSFLWNALLRHTHYNVPHYYDILPEWVLVIIPGYVHNVCSWY